MTEDAKHQLFNASSRGDLDQVRALIDTGAPINARSAAGNTALHIATIKRQVHIVRELVQHPEIELFARSNRTQCTALEMAQEDYEKYGRSRTLRCIEAIERAICIYSGWLCQWTDDWVARCVKSV